MRKERDERRVKRRGENGKIQEDSKAVRKKSQKKCRTERRSERRGKGKRRRGGR